MTPVKERGRKDWIPPHAGAYQGRYSIESATLDMSRDLFAFLLLGSVQDLGPQFNVPGQSFLFEWWGRQESNLRRL